MTERIPPAANGADKTVEMVEGRQIEDYIVTGLSQDGHFRVLSARTTLLVEEGRRRHQTSRTVAGLGESFDLRCDDGRDAGR